MHSSVTAISVAATLSATDLPLAALSAAALCTELASLVHPLPRPWHRDRWQDVAQREDAHWRRKQKCGATFGIHCLDLGTDIASETSHTVKMAIAGRNHKRGATFGRRCLGLGTANAGKTTDNDKMSTSGRIYECGAILCILSLGIGTSIAGKMSHNVKVPTGAASISAVLPSASIASILAP